MDFMIGLPPSTGATIILLIVNKLSKVAHFGSIPTSFTANSVANSFTNKVIKYHGFPLSIVSDKDFIFFSKFWQALFQLSGTTLMYSTKGIASLQ